MCFLALFSVILLTDVLTDYVAVPILCTWVGTLAVEELIQVRSTSVVLFSNYNITIISQLDYSTLK